MPAFAWASAADAAIRVASLNLCTDEYLLLLARPQQIVSVSHLSRSAEESPLWRSALRLPGNDGSLEGVVRFRPNLILTMGGTGRARSAIAKSLGIRLLDLSYPQTPGEVVRQARLVAAALGTPAAAEPFAETLRRLEAQRPVPQEGAFLSQGGLSIPPDSLSARWLALAGFRQPALPGNRLTLEQLAMRPPRTLIRSSYRANQASRGADWLRHPLVRRLDARTIRTDGRVWTCGGLPMIREIARLQRALRP